MRITRENTAGLIIDMQQKLFPHMTGKEFLLKQCITLLRGLKKLNIPVFVTQQYSRGLGEIIPEISGELPERTSPAVEKISFSCCGEPAFMDQLERTGKKNVIVAGIETHVCVLQTGIDLIDGGYLPIIVEDCVSSRKENDRRIALQRLQAEGAVISTNESILFELLQEAGTDEFKAISKYVK